MKFGTGFILISLLASFSLTTSCEEEDLNNVKDVLYVERNGAQTAAHIYGNAASNNFLLILHGGPGGAGISYKTPLMESQIESDYAVIYYDQRAQGMSQGHINDENLSTEEIAKDIDALIEVIRYKYGTDSQIFLLGHSWGGYLGSYYLLKEERQAKITAWIEVDGAHDFPLMFSEQKILYDSIARQQIELNNHETYWQDILDEIEDIDEDNLSEEDIQYLNGEAYKAEGILLTDNIISNPTLDLSLIKHQYINYNILTAASTGQYANDIIRKDGLLESSLTGELHKIKLPTLLLWGSYDLVVPPSLGASALQHLGSEDKSIVYFERSAHSPMYYEEEAYVTVLKSFLDSHK